jgi:predicted  nucleic acid-binding Zn-ribbon protein
MKNFLKKAAILSVFISGAFLHSPLPAYAEDANTIKAQLEQELADIEAQIKDFENQLSKTQGEKKTLTNAINRLRADQDKIRLQIKATTLKINDIEQKLTVTGKEITKTKARKDRLADQIGVILRHLNVQDEQILVESLSAKGGLAEVSQNVESYSRMFFALAALTNETKALNEALEKQQDAYETAQDDAEKLLSMKSAQQNELNNRLSEQRTLLEQTKGQESNYQQSLADARARAAQIRNRIYEMVGGNKQITFAQAVEIAEWVGKATNVRPAFLLAVLTQESSLGKNVGTCNRAGDPPEKGWRVVMKPDRDQEPFLKITGDLGLDPDTTPVSCPMKDSKGKQFGWGGAMGPAQFIPSTWMGYTKKISAITGKTPNPWDITDAFVAAAVKLGADGATAQTEKGEWTAAMKYFAGSVNLKYRFYGDNVAKTTAKYLEEMEQIKTASFSQN